MDDFGVPLLRDPAIALPETIVLPRIKHGPLHKVEFVVELAGPKTAAAAAVSRLLDYDWYTALGHPRLWGMRPSDDRWQPLAASHDGTYDSIALSYPIIRPDGRLDARAASQIMEHATEFGNMIGRRAMPLPQVGEVERLSRELESIRDNLDVGVSFAFAPSRGKVAERDLWPIFAALGLQFGPNGNFEYKPLGAERGLFEVLPIGEADRFSLAAVRGGTQHEGVSLGFRLPTCPNPIRAIEGLLRAGRALCERVGGKLLDENSHFVDARIAQNSINNVTAADTTLRKAGVEPGSAEAVLLWEGPKT
ncbi:hypothetical protein EON79_16135 [bacterium]|nr:MAG: hypothetical protein EON79_16135 [bacterium]